MAAPGVERLTLRFSNGSHVETIVMFNDRLVFAAAIGRADEDLTRSRRLSDRAAAGACAARKVIAAGQAAYPYSLMSPPRMRVRSSLRVVRSCTAAGVLLDYWW
jgi:hypothetical protein